MATEKTFTIQGSSTLSDHHYCDGSSLQEAWAYAAVLEAGLQALALPEEKVAFLRTIVNKAAERAYQAGREAGKDSAALANLGG